MAEEESWSSWNQGKEQAQKTNRGNWKSQNVELKERSGRGVRILRTMKLFWEDVLLIFIRKVTEWSLNSKLRKA